MTQRKTMTRRALIKRGLIGGALIPAGMLFGNRQSLAETPMVDETSPTAKALGYVHDASKVDVAKFPKRSGDAGASQFCDNCSLYVAQDGADKGACAIFPGQTVAGKGWCNSWVKKA